VVVKAKTGTGKLDHQAGKPKLTRQGQRQAQQAQSQPVKRLTRAGSLSWIPVANAAMIEVIAAVAGASISVAAMGAMGFSGASLMRQEMQ
jgi:hypothetical protein